VKLSVVIVNFNNDRVLRGCLDALPLALEGLDAEVILSDNGSTDGSLEWVRDEHPEIRILENGDNLGFAEANNRAFPITRGDYVLLLNPDTVVQNDAFCPMIDLLDSKPEAGAVGCRLLNLDGSRQISTRTFPTLSTYLYDFLGLSDRYPESKRFGGHSMTWWHGDDTREVDWASGAALMVRRSALEATGGIDSYFFLTYDEVDWCHRIRKAGYQIWYTHEGVIMHLDRQSEPQSNPKPEGRIKYMTVERNSRVRYFVKHHGALYATLVEAEHLLLNAALWLKARTLGTNQPPIATMEQGLMVTLYWRTALRVPKACYYGMLRAFGGDTRYPLFVNPYREGHG
jgi:GT2 family glycosyltransferase